MPVVAKVALCLALVAIVAFALSRPSTLRVLNSRMSGEPAQSRPWVEFPIFVAVGLFGAALTGTAISWVEPRAPLEAIRGVLLGVPLVVISLVGLYGATLRGSKTNFLLRAYDGSRTCRRALAVAVCSWLAFFLSPTLVWLWDAL